MAIQDPVYRGFARKRPGFDIEATGLLADLGQTLGMSGLKRLEIYHRYDVSGISRETFEKARQTVFSEAPVDDFFEEHVDLERADFVLAVESLPGQYDQRADSAVQCLQMLSPGESPLCKTARVYAFGGQLSEEERKALRTWLINPVEAREAALEKPASLRDDLPPPQDVPVLDGFRRLEGDAVTGFIERLGLAMSPDDLTLTRDYFRGEGRDPTETEIRVLDTYWSDHCRHTTFLTRIESIDFPDDDPWSKQLQASYEDYLEQRQRVYGKEASQTRPICLMDLATLAMKLMRKEGQLEDLDVSEEINACSIKARLPVDGKMEDYLLQFKNETHNHPTEIEPFGGAATCLGGAIRDPLSGRAYVYQAMRVTGSADPTVPVEQTIPGKLPQRKITTTAAAGYSSYGNQIGLATGQVEELYHPGYVAKRMEIGAVIGAAPQSQVKRERPQPGDVVVLLGGRTGRDGCGGATGSSKAHDESSMETCGSEVQKGNPPTERKIQRLFRDPGVSQAIKRCNDFGAGGVSVAIGELADGLRIDLDRVPRKYDGLDGTELAISESQERMAVVLDPQDLEAFIAAADRENLEATVVAEVTEAKRMVMTWRGQTLVDLSRDFIDSSGAPQSAEATLKTPDFNHPWPEQKGRELERKDFGENLRHALSDLGECSRKGLVERFDSTIGAGTILMPFGGPQQLSPEEGMACLVPTPGGKTDAATLMTFGFDPYLSSWSPYHGAYFAVLHSLSKIVALGGDARKARLTFQEYFERLQSREQWGKPLAALLGAYQAQRDFGVPSVGGKDSMSGTFSDLKVPPTLVSFAVALTTADKVVSATLREDGQAVWLLPVPLKENYLPQADLWQEKLAAVTALAQKGGFAAMATVKANGPAAAVAKMGFGHRLGFAFDPDAASSLFKPALGSLLLAPSDEANEKALLKLGAIRLGQTKKGSGFHLGQETLPFDAALQAFRKPLESVFPSQIDSEEEVPKGSLTRTKAKASRSVARSQAKPRVFIPVFPGTNTEYDTAAAFAKAGAQPQTLVVRNLEPQAIRETLAEMKKAIDQAQILMLPGGFSAGDEPEGSGKFIAAALQNPDLRDAIERLLEQRDGLILGICNGFQALIKLGLLPGGRLAVPDERHPTLTFNRIGRHVSTYAYTRVENAHSPWLSLCEVGQIHAVPVSHGEGRFVADAKALEALIENGQIATRYVDGNGVPSGRTADNPNGSLAAIEGITSPDGRILGKMGHSERQGVHLAQNIPGEKDQKLFAAGVRWFQ